MNQGKHTPLKAHELTGYMLESAPIHDDDENEVGVVMRVLSEGPESLVVIDVGGFLGIGAKRVAVPASALNFMSDEEGVVYATTTLTKEELTDMPEFSG